MAEPAVVWGEVLSRLGLVPVGIDPTSAFDHPALPVDRSDLGVATPVDMAPPELEPGERLAAVWNAGVLVDGSRLVAPVEGTDCTGGFRVVVDVHGDRAARTEQGLQEVRALTR